MAENDTTTDKVRFRQKKISESENGTHTKMDATHQDKDNLERAHSPLVEVKEHSDHVDVYLELRKLASFNELNEQVQKVVASSSWWELYGQEWRDILMGVPALAIGILLLKDGNILAGMIGVFLISIVNFMWSDKGGHLAVHGSLGRSRVFNKLCAEFFINFNGGFSTSMAYDIHIKNHHPHTNIIGLGDSSTWKAPYLGAHVYLYLGPLLLPIMSPLVSTQLLIEKKMYGELLRFLSIVVAGFGFFSWLLVYFAGYTPLYAVLLTFLTRALLAAPYIHVNIFQHIGLPMYAAKSRPVRLYQMSTGVLNLSRNPLLDRIFGHSLINCHVEHHLFPRLSDHMCLKIKPLVKNYLTKNGLPYHERDYMERLKMFTFKYNEYMVKAPPITRFVGIQ